MAMKTFKAICLSGDKFTFKSRNIDTARNKANRLKDVRDTVANVIEINN